jgi:transcriptional regulator with XRE-family HTH domain
MSPPSPLRLERLRRGLRIVDVANVTGLPATRISQLERGEPPAPLRAELELIASAFVVRDSGVVGREAAS